MRRIRSTSFARAASLVWRNGLCDLILVAMAFICYSLVREGSSHRQIEATYNAVDLAQVERALFIAREGSSQHLILWSGFLVRVFNDIYSYGHFTFIGIAGLWLFFRHRPTFVLFRNAFFISGAIALVAFNVFPVAPPRLLPGEFGAVDTLRLFSAVNYENSGRFVNEYAAMPSLHVAWNLLICLAIASVTRNRVIRTAATIMPLVMSITVVVTGNHWILDCVFGYVVGAIGLGLALLAKRESSRVRAFFTGSPGEPVSA